MTDKSDENIKQYIKELEKQYATGRATEHSYRHALQQLLSAMLRDMTVTNEPSRFKCGAPDYIIMRTRDKLPVAFVEAKDIDDSDLDGKRQHKEQFARYRAALSNIVFTDYLDFHLYISGEHIDDVRIAETADDKRIIPIEGTVERFQQLIMKLVSAKPQPITSASRLAEQMARKAQMLRDTIMQTLDNEDGTARNEQLKGQMQAMKKVLLHDITNESFADMYAQTIAYGMFAARLNDTTPENFSRQEAAMLIPQTNPFLRKIFQSIAAYDPYDSIAWIIDDLAATFALTDMPKIMRNYGGRKSHLDPLINFYEDFLKIYNPKLRKKLGVWYTPLPVVQFIVRAVDEILRRDFSLPKGLADNSKIKCDVINDQYERGKRKGGKPTMPRLYHRVQILDPATGTGTFLAETIRCIYSYFKGMEGAWQSYVEEHLIPRLNGFEILMASYAIAHLKLDMQLQETGYKPVNTDKRLQIYLTNSLEEYHPDTGSLWATWLSDEANEANKVKRDKPVMIMMGNPPYSGESCNKGEWIMRLLEEYKREPGGKVKLKERNPKWINDDYVKFMRLAQDYINRNGEGIMAFINAHGYLDNPTFRGMRWSLLQAYDYIYTINLHGNSKRKEVCPDGSADENVFDIMQGVSINIFVKTGKKAKDEQAAVYYSDLWGKRQSKYDYLKATTIDEVQWKELHPKAPMYFFVPKDESLEAEYNKGFGINELFAHSTMGVTTGNDGKYVNKDKECLIRSVAGNSQEINASLIKEYSYRPFDLQWIYYDKGRLARARTKIMQNMYDGNVALLAIRINRDYANTIFVSEHITDKTFLSSKDNVTIFPLFIKDADCILPNFVPAVLSKIEDNLGETVEPLELFDYIYAMLHSPSYRERYKEFLKTDFPRIPYPTQADEYRRMAALGKNLRELHLMKNAATWELATTFPQTGDNKVTELKRTGNKVFINESQYFGNVSDVAWTSFIGGYQPAQKWIKDRNGRQLSYDDITHYRRIIFALEQTNKIMSEIDRH